MSFVASARANAREMSEAVSGWPLDRVVSLMAGTATLTTLGLGRAHDPRWRILTGLIGANLVLQATAGWCPASVGLHMLGLRGVSESHPRGGVGCRA